MTENVPDRLVSRKPIQKTFENLNNFNVNIEWKLAWENASVVSSHFVEDPITKITGFGLPRKACKN